MPNKKRILSPASVLLLVPLTCPSLIMRSHGYTTGVRRQLVGSRTTRSSTTTAPAIASHGRPQVRLRAPTDHHRSSSSTSTPSSWSSSVSLFSSVKTGYYETTLHNDEIPLSTLLEKAAAVRTKWSQQQHSSSEEITTTTTSSLAQLVDLTSSLHNNNNNARNKNALHSLLSFESSYEYTTANRSNDDKDNDTDGETTPPSRRRGYANWLIPGKILVGQYPGGVPEVSTPTREETRDHLRKVLCGFRTDGAPRTSPTTNKVCFVSLQAEVPSQNDVETWQKRNGQIYLLDTENNSRQHQWPNPFTPYKPEVEAVLQHQQAASQKNATYTDKDNHHTTLVDYWHHPIEDLSVPSTNKMNGLLWKILQFLDNEEEDTTLVYLHCWGGRGRAGLTACCLLTLFVWAADVPETKTATATRNITVDTILEIVQTGYASRLGATTLLPPALQRSPQTAAQRQYVAHFFREVQHAAQHATTTPTRAATLPHDTETETR